MYAILTALLLLGCSRSAAEVRSHLTPAQFRDRVIEEIRRERAAASFRRDGDFDLTVTPAPGEKAVQLHLKRAYSLYEADEPSLDGLVAHLARDLTPSGVSSADRLVILVRPPAYADAGQLSRPLAEGLVAVVAADRPENYVAAPLAELKRAYGRDEEEIWAEALRNTCDYFHRPPGTLHNAEPAVIETEDGMAASVLACDDLWDSPAAMARGPLVAFPLARDVVYVVPLSDRDGVSRLRKLMPLVKDDPNGLTNDLLVRRNGRWEVLD